MRHPLNFRVARKEATASGLFLRNPQFKLTVLQKLMARLRADFIFDVEPDWPNINHLTDNAAARVPPCTLGALMVATNSADRPADIPMNMNPAS